MAKEKIVKPPQTLADYYENLAKAVRKAEPEAEAARKRAEEEFREACSRDTAGTIWNIMNYNATQLAALQEQIDRAYPIGALARAIDVLGAQVADLNRRLAVVEGKK